MNTNPSISPITLPPTPSLNGMGSSTPAPGAGASSFQELMMQSLQEVNGMQQQAQSAVEQLATGEDVNMAEVMTAVQKADMSFRLMLQMRNKLVQAYNEIKDIRI